MAGGHHQRGDPRIDRIWRPLSGGHTGHGNGYGNDRQDEGREESNHRAFLTVIRHSGRGDGSASRAFQMREAPHGPAPTTETHRVQPKLDPQRIRPVPERQGKQGLSTGEALSLLFENDRF